MWAVSPNPPPIGSPENPPSWNNEVRYVQEQERSEILAAMPTGVGEEELLGQGTVVAIREMRLRGRPKRAIARELGVDITQLRPATPLNVRVAWRCSADCVIVARHRATSRSNTTTDTLARMASCPGATAPSGSARSPRVGTSGRGPRRPRRDSSARRRGNEGFESMLAQCARNGGGERRRRLHRLDT